MKTLLLERTVTIKIDKNWQQSLPVINDLRQHSTEIKIDALPVGNTFCFAPKTANSACRKMRWLPLYCMLAI
jgi:hypothetical protein